MPKIKRVRTPAGVKKYGQPENSIIVADTDKLSLKHKAEKVKARIDHRQSSDHHPAAALVAPEPKIPGSRGTTPHVWAHDEPPGLFPAPGGRRNDPEMERQVRAEVERQEEAERQRLRKKAESGKTKKEEPPPKKESAEVARRYLDAPEAAEPQLTYDVVSTAFHIGGKLNGLAHRLKKLNSFALKIQRNLIESHEEGNTDATLESEAENVKDLVRYTMVFGTRSYWQDGDNALAELQKLGHKVVKDKGEGHVWFGRSYRGRNIQMQAPNGAYWELQIHTPESKAAVEANHEDYELERHESTPIGVKAGLQFRMGHRFAQVPLPPGTILKDPALKKYTHLRTNPPSP